MADIQEYTGAPLRTAMRQRNLKFDKSIYYRRPLRDWQGRPIEQPGWITTGSYTHRAQFEQRGFEPLFAKFGYIPSNDPEIRDEDGNPAPLRSLWYPILTHPDGPKEFPLEQIMKARWFEKPGLESVFGWGQAPDPLSVFPQLRGAGKITKYRCPDCTEPKREFIDPGGQAALGKHLRIVHEWSRTEMDAWGKRFGIDFKDVYGDPREEVVLSTVDLSTGLECELCDYVTPETSRRPASALRMHTMSAHKPVEVETVG